MRVRLSKFRQKLPRNPTAERRPKDSRLRWPGQFYLLSRRFWRVMRFLGEILIGGVVLGVIANTVYDMSQGRPVRVPTWLTEVGRSLNNPLLISCVASLLVVLGVLTLIARARYSREQKTASLQLAGFMWRPAGTVRPNDLLEGRPFVPCYIERKFEVGIDHIPCTENHVSDLLKKGDQQLSMLGKPGSGKSRTVYEFLHGPLKDWSVLKPVGMAPNCALVDSTLFLGHKVVLLVDDLHKFAGTLDLEELWSAIEGARSRGLIALCREGDEETLARSDPRLRVIFDNATIMHVLPLSVKQGERLAREAGVTMPSYFDGTPASVLMGLGLMLNRFLRMDVAGQTLMKALVLLYHAGVFPFTCGRVLAVLRKASQFLGSVPDDVTWRHAVSVTQTAGFLEDVGTHLEADHVYLGFLGTVKEGMPKPERLFGELRQVLMDERDVWGLLQLADTLAIRYAAPESAIQILDVALGVDSGLPGLWAAKGNALCDLQRYEEAVTAFDGALQLRPSYSGAWLSKGFALGKLHRWNDALTCIDKALNLRPRHVGALRVKAFVLEELGLLEECLTVYETLQGLQPEDYRILLSRASILRILNRREEGLKAIGEAIRLRADFAEAWCTKGYILNGLKRPEEALKAIDEAIRLRADFAEAWCTKGYILNGLKRPEEALKAVDEAIHLKRDSAEAWHIKGYVLNGLKRPEEALKAIDEAIRLKADFAEAWDTKGYILGQADDWAEALQSFDRALELNARYSVAWRNKGYALGKLGRWDQALIALEKSLELDSEDAETWTHKGYTLQRLGHWEQALQGYEKALQLDPERADTLRHKGYILERHAGEHQQAIDLYKQVLRRKPDDAETWNNMGYAFGQLGRWEEALKAIEEAVKLKPDYAAGWNNKGYALIQLERLNEALQVFDHTIQLRQSYAEAWNNKGDALRGLRRFEEALASYEQALHLRDGYHRSLFGKGACLYELGRYADAKKELGLAWQNRHRLPDKGHQTESMLRAMGVDPSECG